MSPGLIFGINCRLRSFGVRLGLIPGPGVSRAQASHSHFPPPAYKEIQRVVALVGWAVWETGRRDSVARFSKACGKDGPAPRWGAVFP